MARFVAIDEIIVDRELDPGDDLTGLTNSIQKTGLKVPILLTQDMELVDGLRRLEALRRLGHTEVEAVVTYMYPVACDAIAAARVHGVYALPLTGDRIWEMYKKLYPLLYITKSFNQRGKARGQKYKSSGGRPLFARTVGISVYQLQALTQVYRLAENPETAEKATEALKLVKEGVLTYNGAVDYVKKVPGLSGDLTGYNEQRETLRASTTSLNALVRALGRLGHLHPKLSKEDVEEIIGELAVARAKLTKTIKLLTEENTNR